MKHGNAECCKSMHWLSHYWDMSSYGEHWCILQCSILTSASAAIQELSRNFLYLTILQYSVVVTAEQTSTNFQCCQLNEISNTIIALSLQTLWSFSSGWQRKQRRWFPYFGSGFQVIFPQGCLSRHCSMWFFGVCLFFVHFVFSYLWKYQFIRLVGTRRSLMDAQLRWKHVRCRRCLMLFTYLALLCFYFTMKKKKLW